MQRSLALFSLALLACGGKAPVAQHDAQVERSVVAAVDAPPPASASKQLQVELPAGGGPTTAKLEVKVTAARTMPWRFEGIVLHEGDQQRVIALGEAYEQSIALPEDGLYRFKVDGKDVLAALTDQDVLHLGRNFGDTWSVSVKTKRPDLAPKAWVKCPVPGTACEDGYLSSPVFDGDPVCKYDEDVSRERCVKAPRLRLRGAATGEATVSVGFEEGQSDDEPQNLGADWIPVVTPEGVLPLVRIGSASLILPMSAGEDWEVWASPSGQIEAALVGTAPTK